MTDHQKEIYEDAVFNDLSLSEIANEQGISRQGVHDLIKRCDRTLNGYEKKLQLIHKFQQTRELVAEIHKLTKQFKETGTKLLLTALARFPVTLLSCSHRTLWRDRRFSGWLLRALQTNCRTYLKI